MTIKLKTKKVTYKAEVLKNCIKKNSFATQAAIINFVKDKRNYWEMVGAGCEKHFYPKNILNTGYPKPITHKLLLNHQAGQITLGYVCNPKAKNFMLLIEVDVADSVVDKQSAVNKTFKNINKKLNNKIQEIEFSSSFKLKSHGYLIFQRAHRETNKGFRRSMSDLQKCLNASCAEEGCNIELKGQPPIPQYDKDGNSVGIAVQGLVAKVPRTIDLTKLKTLTFINRLALLNEYVENKSHNKSKTETTFIKSAPLPSGTEPDNPDFEQNKINIQNFVENNFLVTGEYTTIPSHYKKSLNIQIPTNTINCMVYSIIRSIKVQSNLELTIEDVPNYEQIAPESTEMALEAYKDDVMGKVSYGMVLNRYRLNSKAAKWSDCLDLPDIDAEYKNKTAHLIKHCFQVLIAKEILVIREKSRFLGIKHKANRGRKYELQVDITERQLCSLDQGLAAQIKDVSAQSSADISRFITGEDRGAKCPIILGGDILPPATPNLFPQNNQITLENKAKTNPQTQQIIQQEKQPILNSKQLADLIEKWDDF